MLTCAAIHLCMQLVKLDSYMRVRMLAPPVGSEGAARLCQLGTEVLQLSRRGGIPAKHELSSMWQLSADVDMQISMPEGDDEQPMSESEPESEGEEEGDADDDMEISESDTSSEGEGPKQGEKADADMDEVYKMLGAK